MLDYPFLENLKNAKYEKLCGMKKKEKNKYGFSSLQKRFNELGESNILPGLLKRSRIL